MDLPWRNGILEDWEIVGMNHYHENGSRRLFVSMARDGKCIKIEGLDTPMIWRDLAHLADMSD